VLLTFGGFVLQQAHVLVDLLPEQSTSSTSNAILFY
jgi:hypothetical protein